MTEPHPVFKCFTIFAKDIHFNIFRIRKKYDSEFLQNTMGTRKKKTEAWKWECPRRSCTQVAKC